MLQLSIKSQMSKSKPRTEYQVQYNKTDLWSRNQIHGHSCALQYKTTLKLTTNTFHKYIFIFIQFTITCNEEFIIILSNHLLNSTYSIIREVFCIVFVIWENEDVWSIAKRFIRAINVLVQNTHEDIVDLTNLMISSITHLLYLS